MPLLSSVFFDQEDARLRNCKTCVAYGELKRAANQETFWNHASSAVSFSIVRLVPPVIYYAATNYVTLEFCSSPTGLTKSRLPSFSLLSSEKTLIRTRYTVYQTVCNAKRAIERRLQVVKDERAYVRLATAMPRQRIRRVAGA